jgi:hypothetical protein
MTARPPADFIYPAPKQLAVLAANMRPDWDYEQTRTALIAVSGAGWTDDQIYREMFRLLLLREATPDDLRNAARTAPRPKPDDETYGRGAAAARQALARTTGPIPRVDA